MYYHKILISICCILLAILIYLQLRPKSESNNYKQELDSIQVKIDSVYKKMNKDKAEADAFLIVREHFKETKEIKMEQLKRLPLDSSLNLLKKNIRDYEKDRFSYLIISDSID